MRKAPWPKAKAILRHSFHIYVDPAIKRDWSKTIESKALLRDQIAKLYFPYFRKKERPINLILYKKEKLYSRYAFFRSHPHVRSYFRSSTYSIHIPLQAKRKLWVHEFSHALLENTRSQSPRWLHEGLAGFLDQAKELPISNCQQALKIKVPVHMQQKAHKYPFLEVQRLFQKTKAWNNSHYRKLSVLFFYYLWSRKKMKFYMIEYQREKKAAQKLLLQTLGEQSRYGILKKFHIWLKRAKLKEGVAGC